MICILFAFFAVDGQAPGRSAVPADVMARVLAARRELVTGDVTYQIQNADDADPLYEIRTVFDYRSGKRWTRHDTATRREDPRASKGRRRDQRQRPTC